MLYGSRLLPDPDIEELRTNLEAFGASFRRISVTGNNAPTFLITENNSVVPPCASSKAKGYSLKFTAKVIAYVDLMQILSH